MGDAPVKREGEFEERYGKGDERRTYTPPPSYTIASSKSITEVSDRVTELLQDGWKLYGELKLEKGEYAVWYAQALTKGVR